MCVLPFEQGSNSGDSSQIVEPLPSTRRAACLQLGRPSCDVHVTGTGEVEASVTDDRDGKLKEGLERLPICAQHSCTSLANSRKRAA